MASAKGELGPCSTESGEQIGGLVCGGWRTMDGSLEWAAARTGTSASGGLAAGACSEAVQMDIVVGSAGWGLKFPFR